MGLDASDSSELALNSSNGEITSPLSKRRRTVRKPDEDVDYEPADIERAVAEAILSCKYTEDDRKERLRVAVLDALFKKRTMKSSSQHHGIPFTTLQTYFHRSKQILASEAKQQSFDELFQEQNSSDLKQDSTSLPGSKLDDVLYRLAVSAESGSNDSPMAKDTLQPTGSNKRKPKTVHRVVDCEPLEIANGLDESYHEQEDLQQSFLNQLIANASLMNFNLGDVPMENGDVEGPALPVSSTVRDNFLTYIASFNEFNEEMKEQFQNALLDGSLSKMCEDLNDAVALQNGNYFLNPVDLADDAFERMSVAESNADSKKSDKEYVYGPPLEPEDMARFQAIEKGVRDVCASSMYIGEQKEKLLNAVMMVVCGELTINAASNMMQLPSSTVHPYVHRARSALGMLLPPQASGPTFWTAMKTHDKGEPVPLSEPVEEPIIGCIDVEELDRLVMELVKSSLYDTAGKQRLKDAVVKVLAASVSTAEAGKKHGIPASTIQPYVNRARKAMEERGIGHVIKRDPAAEFRENSPGIASEEEIKEAVRAVIDNGGTHSEARREQLFAAVTAAVSGRVTIKEACHQVDLPPSTAHPYVSKARHLLGSRCPDRKGIAPTEQAATKASSKPSLPPSKKRSSKPEEEDADAHLPMSVRGVSRMLCDTKFDVFAADYKGSKDDLKAKIGKILQCYNYKGSRDVMCDAVAEVFLEGRTLADVCSSHCLAQTTLSTYVRLMKVHIKKELERENGQDIPDEELVQNCCKEMKITNGSCKLKKRDLDIELKLEDDMLSKGESTSSIASSMEDTCIEEVTDAMTLHAGEVLSSQERSMKLTIAYLIKQQYRRSPEAQEKMRICLEDVLLDGLSVSETLKIHKGPTEHVLQVYLSRVRSVYKCIFADYPKFIEEKSKLLKKFDFSRVTQDKPKKATTGRSTRRTNVSAASSTSSPTTRRGTKRSQQQQPEDDEGAGPSDSVHYLNALFTDALLKPMMTYIGKLSEVNFPVEDALVTGLAKKVYEEVPTHHRCLISDETWTEWVSGWRRKHPEYDF